MDDLADVDYGRMLAFHRRHGALVTLSLHAVEGVRAFGVARLEGDRVLGFVEKPGSREEAPSHWVSNGHYVFSPAVFDMLPEERRFMLERDLFPGAAAAGRLYGFRHEGVWLTTNDFAQLDRVRREWRNPADGKKNASI